jgi:hypothetical protein
MIIHLQYNFLYQIIIMHITYFFLKDEEKQHSGNDENEQRHFATIF